jgi:hypothetical protein
LFALTPNTLTAAGELQEPSKRAISKAIADQDQMVEMAKNGWAEDLQAMMQGGLGVGGPGGVGAGMGMRF